MLDRDGVGKASLSLALDEWRDALGRAFVSTEPATAGQASTATFTTSARVMAILRPGSREDVQRCLRIANRHGVPLSPISTGKNWGYGSRAPVRDAVLLDLGRLNRIIEFNEELAYVTLEPGVTQQQLYEFLRERGSRLWMDATGSSPDCSVIGNTLERGFGHTPMGDHCNYACGFEVVMPTGEYIETGFCRFPNARAGPVGRWGTGPSLDGLFSQSNLGVVTKMSVWLMPAPARFQAFIFQTDQAIGPVIDAMRSLRLHGTIRSVVHIGNDYKVLSGTGQFPWEATGGRVPLSADAMARLRGNLRIARWSGSGALYGSAGQVAAARDLVRRALAGKVDRLRFFDDRTLRLLSRIERPYRLITRRDDLRRALQILPPLLDLLKGVPTSAFLASAYWRKKTPVPDRMDPDADKCGLLWCSPVAPAAGKDVTELTDLATDVALKHGFEPIISVSLISERMAVTTIALTYDRDVADEDARALACYRVLTESLLDAGFPPYRLNVASMNYGRTQHAYTTVMRSIKAAVDPKAILAPGRYD